jgi:hypothetical protein
MKIQHIRRNADDLRELFDDEVLGRIGVIVLDRVEVGADRQPFRPDVSTVQRLLFA